jgi:diguanylate cyclase (GGDEF)-like protein
MPSPALLIAEPALSERLTRNLARAGVTSEARRADIGTLPPGPFCVILFAPQAGPVPDRPEAPPASLVGALLSAYPDAPLIVVGEGRDGGESGRAALRAGAHEVLGRDACGPVALTRAVEAARIRAARAGAGETELRAVVDALDEGIVLLDEEDEALFANRQARETLGHRLESLAKAAPLSGEPALSELPPPPGQSADAARFVETRKRELVVGERTYRVLAARDVTLDRLSQEELRDRASRDALTQLSNRSILGERLRRALNRCERIEGYRLAVILVDLDGFKAVNDGYGHFVGDELLKEVARRLGHCVRTLDTVARLGGDEFVILLDGIRGREDALRAAGRVLDMVSRPIPLGERRHTITASLGIALSLEGQEEPEALLRDADAALYRAKAAGGRRYQVFEGEIRDRDRRVRGLEGDIAQGLARGEFRLDYQPVVQLATGALVAFEALLRWERGNGAERRTALPAEFLIPVAGGRAGLALGEWALEEVGRQQRRWVDELGAVTPAISVNVTPAHLLDAGFLDCVRDTLKVSGTDPTRLVIEVTEPLVLQNERAARESTEKLADLGVRIGLDDFGTGAVAVSLLAQLPLAMVKLDRRDLPLSRSGAGRLTYDRALVALAHEYGVAVVAEAVETPQQLRHSRAAGFDMVQGFEIAAPMSAGRALDWALG